MTTARLITPQGQTIKLTAEDYREIMALLQRRRAALPADQLEAIVNEMYGKYAGGPSLAQALLQARRKDQKPEDEDTTVKKCGKLDTDRWERQIGLC